MVAIKSVALLLLFLLLLPSSLLAAAKASSLATALISMATFSTVLILIPGAASAKTYFFCTVAYCGPMVMGNSMRTMESVTDCSCYVVTGTCGKLPSSEGFFFNVVMTASRVASLLFPSCSGCCFLLF